MGRNQPACLRVSGLLTGWVALGLSRGRHASTLDSTPPPLKRWATRADAGFESSGPEEMGHPSERNPATLL